MSHPALNKAPFWTVILIVSVLLSSCMGGLGEGNGISGLSGISGATSNDGSLNDGTPSIESTGTPGIPTDTGTDSIENDALPQAYIPLPNLTNSLVSNPDGDDNAVLQGTGYEPDAIMVVTDVSSTTAEDTNAASRWLRPIFKPLAQIWTQIKKTIVADALADDVDATDTNPCNDGNPAITCVTIPEDGHLIPTVLPGVHPEDTLSFAYFDATLGKVGEAANDSPLTNVLYTAGVVDTNSTTGNDNNLVQIDSETGVMKKFSMNGERIIPTAGNLDNDYEWTKTFRKPLELLYKRQESMGVDGTSYSLEDCQTNPTDKHCGHFILRFADNIYTFAIDADGTKTALPYNTNEACRTEIKSGGDALANKNATSPTQALNDVHAYFGEGPKAELPCHVSHMKLRSTSWYTPHDMRLYYTLDYDAGTIQRSLGLQIYELYDDLNTIKFTFDDEHQDLTERYYDTQAFDVYLNPIGNYIAALVYHPRKNSTALKLAITTGTTGSSMPTMTADLSRDDIKDLLIYDYQQKTRTALNGSEKEFTTYAGEMALFSDRGIDFVGLDTNDLSASQRVFLKNLHLTGKIHTVTSSELEDDDTDSLESKDIHLIDRENIELPNIITYAYYNPKTNLGNNKQETDAEPTHILFVLSSGAAGETDLAPSFPQDCLGACIAVVELENRKLMAGGLPEAIDPNRDGYIRIADLFAGKTIAFTPKTLFFQQNREIHRQLLAIGTDTIDSVVLLDLGLEDQQLLTSIQNGKIAHQIQLPTTRPHDTHSFQFDPTKPTLNSTKSETNDTEE
jgi:hypothetical protein